MIVPMANQDNRQSYSSSDEALRALQRRKAGARRTAWIIAAIVIAFFVASLVQGHFAGIPNWVPPR